MADLISVIVTTYNREDALEAVLRSLARQTDRDFEVVVADDGSAAATRRLIEGWKATLGRPLDHVWHDDQGFRAAEIRNRAILVSRGAYCIFLDGDCIVRPDFVATHRRLAEPGWFVTGNRILFSALLTAQSPAGKTCAGNLELRRLGGGAVARRSQSCFGACCGCRSGRCARCAKAHGRARAPAILRSGAPISTALTVSMPITPAGARKNSDIIVRLLHAGVRRKDGVFATGVLHLWHPEADRGKLADNERKLSDIVAGDRVRARRGLSALQPAPSTARAAG